MRRIVTVDWCERDDGYTIVRPNQGLIGYLIPRLCPGLCDGVAGHMLSGGAYIEGFRLTSEGFEGGRDAEDKAFKVARICILEFLRPIVLDIGPSGGFEVLFRRTCVAIGLVDLWLRLVPFRFDRVHLSSAGRALGAPGWTANTIDQWVASAAGAASDAGAASAAGAASDVLHRPPRVDRIEICASGDFDHELSGICRQLEEAALSVKTTLRFVVRSKNDRPKDRVIRCEIYGCRPDVDQDEVCNAIRSAVDDMVPTPHSHEFDFCFWGPEEPELGPEEAAAAKEKIREERRARHRVRRAAAAAAAP